MTKEEAIKWIDDRMCYGRGKWSEHHLPEIDEYWQAGEMAIKALAQPEIIRCKDCDWWTKQEASLQGRCALMGMYPTGGWFCGNARKRKVTE